MNIFSTTLVNEIGKNDVNYIEAGIQENVKLTEVRVDKSRNNSRFIEFTFTKDNKNLKSTIYEPTKFADMSDEDFQESAKKIMTRLMQFVWAFYEEGTIKFEASTWEEGFNWVKTVLDQKKDSELVRIKAVYGNPNAEGKQYVELPRYWMYTFIENMRAEKSRINKLAIDTFERVKADEAKPAQSGFSFVQKDLANAGMHEAVIEAIQQPVLDTTPWSAEDSMPF